MAAIRQAVPDGSHRHWAEVPEDMKPRLLDAFCGAGGATKGYQRAGFHVVGVDNRPQPHYCGDEFIQTDALDYLAELVGVATWDQPPLWVFEAVHASPPCQLYSNAQRINDNDHHDLVGPLRELLDATGLPYVIENVRGAPLRHPVCLEGQMFDGLRTVRPRYFETNWPLDVPLLRFSRPPQTKMGRPPRDGEYMHVVGHFSDVTAARAAMGIDWMTRDELKEAIPPPMTEMIGHQLIQHVNGRVGVLAAQPSPEN